MITHKSTKSSTRRSILSNIDLDALRITLQSLSLQLDVPWYMRMTYWFLGTPLRYWTCPCVKRARRSYLKPLQTRQVRRDQHLYCSAVFASCMRLSMTRVPALKSYGPMQGRVHSAGKPTKSGLQASSISYLSCK